LRSYGGVEMREAGVQLVGATLTALFSITVAWALATVITGVTWGSAPMVLLVSGGLAVATAGLALLCAVAMRTPRQSQAIATLVGALMLIAGGSLVPIWDQPGWLRAIAAVVPTGMALRAQFLEAMGAGVSTAAVAALFVVGAVAFGISGRVLRGAAS
jgi:ABC-type multidrug transport system permease subunit